MYGAVRRGFFELAKFGPRREALANHLSAHSPFAQDLTKIEQLAATQRMSEHFESSVGVLEIGHIRAQLDSFHTASRTSTFLGRSLF